LSALVLLERLSSKEKQKPHTTPLRKVVVVALGISTGAFASDHPVRQIDVDFHWGGLGTPQAFHLTIRADKGDVDAMRVQALVEALAAPRMARPNLR
jgi:hypothetical protein